MSNIALYSAYSAAQLSLVRRTVARDCNDAEFDWFMSICRSTRLNPLTRDIYAFVFYKNDAERRQLTPVTSIKGMRGIAARTGNYRADNRKPRYEVSEAAKNADTNPHGIVSAEVSVFQFSHGEWHEIVGEARWDEFAPIVKKDGKLLLDPKKDGWKKMPFLMVAKCAESQALRRGWPDDLECLYEQAEIDKGEVLDLTATEVIHEAEQKERLERIGGPSLTIDWMDGGELQGVPVGQFHDKAMAYLRTCAGQPMSARAFADRNRHALKEFWALDKAAALAIKHEIERIQNEKVVEVAVDEPKAHPVPAGGGDQPMQTRRADPLPKLKLREEASSA